MARAKGCSEYRSALAATRSNRPRCIGYQFASDCSLIADTPGHDFMNSQRLQYYIHDESDILRLQLAGSLSGAGVESVYQAWHTSLSIIGNRPLIIDITFVVDADEHGCAVLDAWRRSGARIIAASAESQALAEAVLGEPIPVAQPKQSWLRRLGGFVLGYPTVAQRAPVGRQTRHCSQMSPSECRR
jgi:hypothetical protein